eukprot:gene19216-23024_t
MTEVATLKEQGNLELWNKNYSGALDLFSKASLLDPTNMEIHLSKAEKKKTEVGDDDDELAKVVQMMSRAFARLGTAYMGENNYKESKKYILQAIDTYNCSEFEEMLSGIEELIKLTSSEAMELFKLAGQAYYQKSYNDACNLYTEAIIIDDDNNILYANRSMCYIKLKQYQNALEDSQKAIEIQTRDGGQNYLPYYCQANALYFMKKFEQALKYYKEAQKLRPNLDVLQKRIVKTTKLIKVSPKSKKVKRIVSTPKIQRPQTIVEENEIEQEDEGEENNQQIDKPTKDDVDEAVVEDVVDVDAQGKVVSLDEAIQDPDDEEEEEEELYREDPRSEATEYRSTPPTRTIEREPVLA